MSSKKRRRDNRYIWETLNRPFTGMDPIFDASDDYLKTVIRKRSALHDAPEKQQMPLKTPKTKDIVPKNVPKNVFQGQLLEMIKTNPRITYNELAGQTRRDRKTVQRHLKALKDQGLVRRIGPAKGGYWEVLSA